MGLVAIRERTIGIIYRADVDFTEEVGVYAPHDKYSFNQGKRSYHVLAIGWAGLPEVFSFFRNNLEYYKTFDKAFEATVNAMTVEALRTFQLLLAVERSDARPIKPTMVDTFIVSFQKATDVDPLKIKAKIQDNGKSRYWIYIANESHSISAKTPLKEVEFIKAITL